MESVFQDQQFQEFFLPTCLFHPTRLLESLEYMEIIEELGQFFLSVSDILHTLLPYVVQKVPQESKTSKTWWSRPFSIF